MQEGTANPITGSSLAHSTSARGLGPTSVNTSVREKLNQFQYGDLCKPINPKRRDSLQEVYKNSLNLVVAAVHESECTFTYEHFVFELMELLPEEPNREGIRKVVTFAAYTLMENQPESSLRNGRICLYRSPSAHANFVTQIIVKL